MVSGGISIYILTRARVTTDGVPIDMVYASMCAMELIGIMGLLAYTVHGVFHSVSLRVSTTRWDGGHGVWDRVSGLMVSDGVMVWMSCYPY